MTASEGIQGLQPAGQLFGLIALVLAGCAGDRPRLDNALMADHGQAARQTSLAGGYLAYCPDVLELQVASRPDLCGPFEIGPDGRISLGPMGRVRVEGHNICQIALVIADVLDLPPSAVDVRVLEYRSQQIFLFGQVVGLQRPVPYRGAERVSDLLQRAGGITPGASTGDVYVVRPNLREGRSPEVFQVDLSAILLRQDQKTNIALQPFDQVFVGESRSSAFERCVPPWLKPTYESLSGMGWAKYLPHLKKKPADQVNRKVAKTESVERPGVMGKLPKNH